MRKMFSMYGFMKTLFIEFKIPEIVRHSITLCTTVKEKNVAKYNLKLNPDFREVECMHYIY